MAVSFVLVLVAAMAGGGGLRPAYGADHDHRPPTDAPILEAFRPPAQPWGPGNRGLKYATTPGSPVRATGAGEVSFAGAVAGALHVTVAHPDGLRTSYSFLATVEVSEGQRLAQGDVVGTAGSLLHLGARLGDAYLDPAGLFDGTDIARARLIPFEEPPGPGRDGERSALRQLVGGTLRAVGRGARWLAGQGEHVVRHLAHHLNVTHTWALDLSMAVLTVVSEAQRDARRPCTPAGVPPPRRSGRRVAVLVGGLGSTSERAAIDDLDVAGLGYAPGDVARFSYAGGRVPGPGVIDAVQRPYDASHTLGDLRQAGRDLADLLEAAVRAAAGAPLDVFAHSQGGLVTRLAIEELVSRHGAAWVEALGVVATLGTPHGGADLATLAASWQLTSTGDVALEALGEVGSVLGFGVDPSSTAVGQLSEESELIRSLPPWPAGVNALSIAAGGDLVVPVPRTRSPGATSVVVGLYGLDAHGSLPGSDAAHRELALAIGGAPPTCISFRSSLLHRSSGEVLSELTDKVGGAGLVGLIWADVRTPLKAAVPLNALGVLDAVPGQ